MVRTMVVIGCFVFGVGLLYLGYQETQSMAGGITKAFRGRYSTETIMYLAGGGVLLLAGLALSVGKRKKRKKVK